MVVSVTPIRLLQFVGVALPAVAILLRVVTNTDEDSFGGRTTVTLVRTSFVGLTLAGVLFTVEVLDLTDRLLLEVGVVSVALALAVLIPGVTVGGRLPSLAIETGVWDGFGDEERIPAPVVPVVAFGFLLAAVGVATVAVDLPATVPLQVSPTGWGLVGTLVLVTGATSLAVWRSFLEVEEERSRRELLDTLDEVRDCLPRVAPDTADDLDELSDDVSERRGELQRFGHELTASPADGDLRDRLREVSRLADEAAAAAKAVDTYESELSHFEEMIERKRERRSSPEYDAVRQGELETELEMLESERQRTTNLLEDNRDDLEDSSDRLESALATCRRVATDVHREIDPNWRE